MPEFNIEFVLSPPHISTDNKLFYFNLTVNAFTEKNNCLTWTKIIDVKEKRISFDSTDVVLAWETEQHLCINAPEFVLNFGYNAQFVPEHYFPQIKLFYFEKDNRMYDFGWHFVFIPVGFKRWFKREDGTKRLYAFDSSICDETTSFEEACKNAYQEGFCDGLESANNSVGTDDLVSINNNSTEINVEKYDEQSEIEETTQESEENENEEVKEINQKTEIPVEEIVIDNSNVIVVETTTDKLRKIETPLSFLNVASKATVNNNKEENKDIKKINGLAAERMKQQTVSKPKVQFLSIEDKYKILLNRIIANSKNLSESEDKDYVILDDIQDLITEDTKHFFSEQRLYKELVSVINEKKLGLTIFFKTTLFNKDETNECLNVICKFGYVIEMFNNTFRNFYNDLVDKVENDELTSGTIFRFDEIPEFKDFLRIFTKDLLKGRVEKCVNYFKYNNLLHKLVYIDKKNLKFVINESSY